MLAILLKVPPLQSLPEARNAEGARARTAKRAAAIAAEKPRTDACNFVVLFIETTALPQFLMVWLINIVFLPKIRPNMQNMRF
jgi:hypothetical protein